MASSYMYMAMYMYIQESGENPNLAKDIYTNDQHLAHDNLKACLCQKQL